MSNEFIHQCLNVLKRDNVQSEINHISKPIINYIFFSIKSIFIFIFLINYINFYITFSNNHFINSNNAE